MKKFVVLLTLCMFLFGGSVSEASVGVGFLRITVESLYLNNTYMLLVKPSAIISPVPKAEPKKEEAPVKPPVTDNISGKTPIMGQPALTAEAMDRFVRKINPNAPVLAQLYLDIGKMEGIRGDLAFAQAMWETNYFRYGGQVQPEQNNYCGLGAVDGGAKGASFITPYEGVLAHIQHLKAYANNEPLKTPLVDPRFHLVKRGIAPNLEDLTGKWASDKNYDKGISRLFSSMVNFK